MRKFLASNLERDEQGGWRWTINLPVITQALPQLEGNSLQSGDRHEGPSLFIAGGQRAILGKRRHRRHRQQSK
jgi:hypothetical protein